MARYSSFQNAPFTRWNGVPIYLTTILTALFVAGLLFTAVAGAVNPLSLELFIFSMPLRPAWSWWRLATYIFVGPLSFFTPFAILCFYWWSMGIETHLGRESLAKLLGLLLLAGPAVSAFWFWGLDAASFCAGNYAFTAGLLIAFATLYPTTEAWGWVPFKWVAFACVLCGSLMLLSARDWLQLSQLWVSCIAGFLYMRHAKEMEYDDAPSAFARLGKLFRRRPKFRVLPSPSPRVRPSLNDNESFEVDALLDKIAKHGMQSLTPGERKKLEQARETLIKKEKR